MNPTDTDMTAALAQILSDVAGIDPEQVTADKHLVDDLDLDSLSMVETGIVVEERLGVNIPEEEVGQFVTVGDMVAYLERARTGA